MSKDALKRVGRTISLYSHHPSLKLIKHMKRNTLFYMGVGE
jgi:hypothetical protein